jgi:hypothetical protein
MFNQVSLLVNSFNGDSSLTGCYFFFFQSITYFLFTPMHRPQRVVVACDESSRVAANRKTNTKNGAHLALIFNSLNDLSVYILQHRQTMRQLSCRRSMPLAYVPSRNKPPKNNDEKSITHLSPHPSVD